MIPDWKISYEPGRFPWVARSSRGTFECASTRWGIKRLVRKAIEAQRIAELENQKLAAQVAKLNAELKEMK